MEQPSADVAAQRRVRAVIERLLRDRSVVAQADGSVHEIFPVAASPAEGVALREWVRRAGAMRTIEVGLGYGFSALHIGEGLLGNPGPARRHTAIDPFQATRFAGCGLQLLDEAGLGAIVEHLALRSEIALPQLLDEGRRFDLAFIDGNHRFEGVFLDLIYLGRLVRAGGVIILDDYQLPAIQRAVAFCLTNLGWTREEVASADDRHRWVALRTSPLPDTRPYDYYVEF
jgi:predicted O-methyltransferase YrrM